MAISFFNSSIPSPVSAETKNASVNFFLNAWRLTVEIPGREVSISDKAFGDLKRGVLIKTYDNLYSKDVICKEIKEPYLTSDKLLEKITNNEDNIQFYIKNANFINLNVGNYELNNYKELNEEITIEYLNNMYDILYQITKINKANINLINIYDDKGDFKLINKKLSEYSKKFKINYIDLNKLDKSYFTYFDDKVYINSKGMYKINEILTKNSW